MSRGSVNRFLSQIVFPAFVLLLIGAIAFRDFLFGDALLLYKDIGSDSLNYYYPYLLLFSDYIRSEGLPLWSFRVGLGQTLFPDIGVLVFNPAAWFPREIIAHLLVYQHLFLAVLAGVFFLRFLMLRGLNLCASVTGAALLAFSAYMTMGSCFTICAGEVVCVAFALFALETALVRGRWIYLPIAVLLFALLTAFHLYLAALLIAVYALARIVAARGWSWRFQRRRLMQLAAIAFLGAGLGAIVWTDSIIQILNSPRGSGTASYAGKLSGAGIFDLESPLHYFTIILRSFANELTGAGNSYRGWYNYLEASLSYCGIFSLVMLPQIFVRAGRRRRIVAALFLGAMLVALVFPWFRYLFYLFQGNYFRAFSLFSATGMVILSATAFSHYLRARALNLWLLLGTTLVLLGLLYLPLGAMQKLADPALQRLVAIFLVAYAVLLLLGRLLKREALFGWLILAVIVAELGHFNFRSVSGRSVVTKQERQERVGFNDYTIEALREINAREKPFFRVSKLYSSSEAEHANLNDSFAFDYYGSSSYVSFNNLHVIKFLVSLAALPPQPTEIDTRWAHGFLGRPLLAAFGCEKYLLTREAIPPDNRLWYESAGQAGDIFVYRSTLGLPFGLFFEKAIPESLFNQFSAVGKQDLLFQLAVLDDQRFAALFPGEKPPELDELFALVETKTTAELLNLSRQNALQLESFRQNRIEGKIACLRNGFLVFQMPFEPGWRVFVDGQRVQPLRVDIGFLGVPLAAGNHQIRLRYLPPGLWIGGPISLLSLLVSAFSWWRWPRLQNTNEALPAA